jgi:hypothetical protein
VDAKDYPRQSPDDVCAGRIHTAGVELRLIAGDVSADELPLVLVRGEPEALRFLAELLQAVADSPTLPARFQMSPNGAGRFHFSASAEIGLYIECVEALSDSSGGETNST